VIAGILLLVIGAININNQHQQRTANILNDIILIIMFLISAVNIIISSFGLRHNDNSVFYPI